MTKISMKLLSYPDKDFIKESWSEGGKDGFIGDLCVFWHSPIELIIDDKEILKSVIDARWQGNDGGKGLAIPLNEFWTTWVELLEKIKQQSGFTSTPITVGHGIIDDLSIRATKHKEQITIELIDNKKNQVLSSAITDYQSLVNATKECRKNVISELVKACLDSDFIVNGDDFESDAFLVDMK